LPCPEILALRNDAGERTQIDNTAVRREQDSKKWRTDFLQDCKGNQSAPESSLTPVTSRTVVNEHTKNRRLADFVAAEIEKDICSFNVLYDSGRRTSKRPAGTT